MKLSDKIELLKSEFNYDDLNSNDFIKKEAAKQTLKKIEQCEDKINNLKCQIKISQEKVNIK